MKMFSCRIQATLTVLFLLLALALPAAAQTPLLTLVLSGNTYGNYEPCPS
ncbi:MAG: hypothetical protein AB9867_05085 [Solidesulfovibrio sp.]